MNTTTPFAEATFRDRRDRLVFRGDRVRHVGTGLEYVVNNIVSTEHLDAVREDQGVRALVALFCGETELVG